MLEFLDNEKVQEVFTFSVAPQGVEFDYPQRISETKTFGGSVFDDYGNDTYRITISGTTINEDKKFIYRGEKPPLYLSGSKEIAELQKIIKNWADGKDSSEKGKLQNRKVYLYDLSRMSMPQVATGTATRNYWRIFIKDLKTKQDKSNPRAVTYTLEMTAVEDSEKKAKGWFGESNIQEKINDLQKKMDGANSFMEITEATTAAFNETAVLINNFKSNLSRMSVRQIATASLDSVTRILGADSSSLYNDTANILLGVQNFKAICNNSESGIVKKSSSENNSFFIVQFNTNGGSYVKTKKVSYCKVVEKPTDPTKEHYSFAGWYSDSELTAEYDFTQEVTQAITLHAKWALATAKVIYNSRNGTTIAPQYVTVGEKVSAPTNPTRSGYVFDTWCTDSDLTHEFDFSTPITENITLYARWTRTCAVTFNTNGGSSVDTQSVGVGGLAVYPRTPTRDNYIFAYWCMDSELQNPFDFLTPITANITLYACWVRISNTVTFNSMDGSPVASQDVSVGGYAAEPTAPTKDGYDFVYWSVDELGTERFRFGTAQVKANITLYAKWAEKTCTVSFDTDGGSEVESQIVSYGKKAVFPSIPTKENRGFAMWRTRKEVEVDSGETDENGAPIMTVGYEYEEFDFNTEVKEDITLYALWFGGE